MYFLISFLSSFSLSFLFFKNFRKKTNENFLKQTTLFLEKDEKIIEYSLIRQDAEYTVSAIIGFFCYLIISVYIPNTYSRVLFSDIFLFDYSDLFFFIALIIMIIIWNDRVFSEILVCTNKAIIHICKNKTKNKIKFVDIKEIKYYSFNPFIGMKILMIKLKSNKNIIISDFSNSKNMYINICKMIKMIEE